MKASTQTSPRRSPHFFPRPGLLLALVVALAPLFQALASPASRDRVVARVFFRDLAQLQELGRRFDVWEVHRQEGYAVVMLTEKAYGELSARGYPLEVDAEKTAEVRAPLSIPGYTCYRTVEETQAALGALAASYPGLVELKDAGDSWDKLTAGGPAGYDLLAVRLTNRSIPGPKPVFLLVGETHARELATAETALRFVEHLLTNYAVNADIALTLDYAEVWVLPMHNPDGRKFAETGEWWRKNTDSTAGGGCAGGDYGIDLNRNCSFLWGGDSSDPCDETYQGPAAGSEPETTAAQALARFLFPDQRGPGINDPAPDTTTGLSIWLHSYGGDVIWPWGHTYGPAPNSAGLQAIGTKLASLNNYTPNQSSTGLYTTTGATDDFVYGELGVPSFTFEIGTSFFQSCTSFENTVWPANRTALLYAMKICGTPYRTALGPDVRNLAATPPVVAQGMALQLQGQVNDTANGGQNAAGAEYWVLPLHDADGPGAPGSGAAMQPSDGSWSAPSENAQASVSTGALAEGDYLAAVRGKDAAGNWGPFSAVFFTVTSSSGCIPPSGVTLERAPVVPEPGQPAAFTATSAGTLPLVFAWTFGDGATATGPSVSHVYAAGTYTARVTVTNPCGQASAQQTFTVTLIVAPAIVSQPQGRLVLSGRTATLQVGASGTPPLSYQWYRGDRGDTSSPVAGATAFSFTTPSLTQSAAYWVRVSNDRGAADSDAAVVRVLAAAYDVDGDGSVTAMDAVLLAAILSGNAVSDPSGNSFRGDVDKDRDVTAVDLLKLLGEVTGA
ncbi:MAG: PKD domain-containing protein [Acidobacteria bacterium]|nr:PKD domain-containing protein [Acidobacteriota bacterium]